MFIAYCIKELTVRFEQIIALVSFKPKIYAFLLTFFARKQPEHNNCFCIFFSLGFDKWNHIVLAKF